LPEITQDAIRQLGTIIFEIIRREYQEFFVMVFEFGRGRWGIQRLGC
jgi:hypothetical protein